MATPMAEIHRRDAWEWLRNPLPPGDEEPTFASLRLQLGIPDHIFFTDKGFGSLGFFEQQTVLPTLESGYYREHNPIVRHTVRRRRRTLEEAGLLEQVAVTIHPDPQQPAATYTGVGTLLPRAGAQGRGRETVGIVVARCLASYQMGLAGTATLLGLKRSIRGIMGRRHCQSVRVC